MSCKYALSVQHSQRPNHRNGHKLMTPEHDMARLFCVEYFRFLSIRSCPMRLDVWAQSATEKLCKGFNAMVLFLIVDLTLLLSCGYYILCIRNPDQKCILAPFAFCSPPQKIFWRNKPIDYRFYEAVYGKSFEIYKWIQDKEYSLEIVLFQQISRLESA